jgi:hypothetical protein
MAEGVAPAVGACAALCRVAGLARDGPCRSAGSAQRQCRVTGAVNAPRVVRWR